MRSHSPRRLALCLVAALCVAIDPAPAAAQAPPPAFDLDTGNAPIELIIPTVAPVILSPDVSPSGSDITLVVRVTTLVTNGWFDASAPYHPTAVGVYSSLGRRPSSEASTNRNINIACLYATYHVMNSLLPHRSDDWRAMLAAAGLDPDDASEDTVTPIGIGNMAGHAVVAAREHDGMNQLGDEGGCRYNCRPYADYTGYEPVNTAYELRDPSRWQPRIVGKGNGAFAVQQFVTPQNRLVTPYAVGNPRRFHVPRPSASEPWGRGGHAAYKAQADEVLEASAHLNDYRKMSAELFNNKIVALGFSAVFAAQSRGLSLLDFIHLDFVTNVAAFDSVIVAWQEKRRWDAVRPFSAIAHVYGDRPVTAWGGPGRGTVTDLPASQWAEYVPVADHPEYPSISTTACEAHAQAARRFLQSDALNWSVFAPQGSSVIEPGLTPASDLVLGPYPTWTSFATECGLARIWGGVHFPAAVAAGRLIGPTIGELAYRFVDAHIGGIVP